MWGDSVVALRVAAILVTGGCGARTLLLCCVPFPSLRHLRPTPIPLHLESPPQYVARPPATPYRRLVTQTPDDLPLSSARFGGVA